MDILIVFATFYLVLGVIIGVIRLRVKPLEERLAKIDDDAEVQQLTRFPRWWVLFAMMIVLTVLWPVELIKAQRGDSKRD